MAHHRVGRVPRLLRAQKNFVMSRRLHIRRGRAVAIPNEAMMRGRVVWTARVLVYGLGSGSEPVQVAHGGGAPGNREDDPPRHWAPRRMAQARRNLCLAAGR